MKPLAHQYPTAPSSLSSQQILSKQNILAVLVHRTDHEARVFVKAHKLTPEYKAIKRGSIVLNKELKSEL